MMPLMYELSMGFCNKERSFSFWIIYVRTQISLFFHKLRADLHDNVKIFHHPVLMLPPTQGTLKMMNELCNNSSREMEKVGERWDVLVRHVELAKHFLRANVKPNGWFCAHYRFFLMSLD